jgi:mono/diheme cytochrome c family protein
MRRVVVRSEAMRKLTIAAGIMTFIGMGSGGVLADARSGQIIAERWCSACHLVGPDQALATDGVATFAEVARREDVTVAGLRAFLASPHPAMPDMALTRNEIRDLVAYIESLD